MHLIVSQYDYRYFFIMPFCGRFSGLLAVRCVSSCAPDRHDAALWRRPRGGRQFGRSHPKPIERLAVMDQKNLSVWICPSGTRQRMTSKSFIASTIGGGPAK